MDEDSGELEDKMKDKEDDDEDVDMEHHENYTENTFIRGNSYSDNNNNKCPAFARKFRKSEGKI